MFAVFGERWVRSEGRWDDNCVVTWLTCLGQVPGARVQVYCVLCNCMTQSSHYYLSSLECHIHIWCTLDYNEENLQKILGLTCVNWGGSVYNGIKDQTRYPNVLTRTWLCFDSKSMCDHKRAGTGNPDKSKHQYSDDQSLDVRDQSESEGVNYIQMSCRAHLNQCGMRLWQPGSRVCLIRIGL